MAEQKKVYERVSGGVGEKISRETREAVRRVAEEKVRDLVDRGFREDDVRPHVADGVDGARRDVR